MSDLRVGVVGVGYFGRFHVMKLSTMKRVHLVGVMDTDERRCRAVAREFNCRAFASLSSLVDACDALIIASPAHKHYEQACAVLREKRHVFIEKPLAQTIDEAKTLARLVEQTHCICQVGHLLRFSPSYRLIREKMSSPLYIETIRMAPYRQRGTDVSVVLDMMTHDLDLVLALVDSPIEHVEALGATVTSSCEDIANARINFENGCVATLMVSRISLKQERRLRMFSQSGYMSADFKKQHVKWINRQEGIPIPGSKGFRLKWLKWGKGDPLREELEAFVSSCLDGTPVRVNVTEGLRVLGAAQAILEETEKRKEKMQRSGLLHLE